MLTKTITSLHHSTTYLLNIVAAISYHHQAMITHILALCSLYPGLNMADVSEKNPDKSKINVLAFDGGGSRGVMEIMILDDVMRLYTIFKEQPERFVSKFVITNELILKKDNLVEFNDLLRSQDFPEEKLVHPTDVFDAICGTSTGALISFGLVGGSTDDYVDIKLTEPKSKPCIPPFAYQYCCASSCCDQTDELNNRNPMTRPIRTSMTVEEVTKMYKTATPSILTKVGVPF